MMRKQVSYFLVFLLAATIFTGCAKEPKSEASEPKNTPKEKAKAMATMAPTTSKSLAFPTEDYEEQTETVPTSAGERVVTYRYYKHICYVKQPVDSDYQSMDVKVPIRIDNEEIDASEAPILFANSVGGYLSASNADTEGNNQFTEDIRTEEEKASGKQDPMKRASKDELNINNKLALAAGYVVVEPGCRGRDNQDKDEKFYGKAPAAVVDLKAAIRYLHYNDETMPGNADYIITTGTSAGGAISAVLGASGDSILYEDALNKLGAANASDKVYACACYCPITDLNHADMAYEWMFGTSKVEGKLVDQNMSKELKAAFREYQQSLMLEGKNHYGVLSADNYSDYLLQEYLIPAANRYLKNLTDSERATYLKNNPWIIWKEDNASFTFADYQSHIGRSKQLPAFDALDLSTAENSLFGTNTTNARHFTKFSIDNTTVVANEVIDLSLEDTINMMNPMYFIDKQNKTCADYWWIRYGTSDTNTSLPVIVNLATALENTGHQVDLSMYWDGGHGANEDPEEFIAWIGQVTGYPE
ncbi:esterase/lipase [Lachnospiraceae bacterium KM106-2]|nr:esterase/lipase [Lachnospiraceae bacterium KM106-2]